VHYARDGRPATISRRSFAASALGWTAANALAAETAHVSGRIKVTEIEAHRITVEYHDWIAYQLNHYCGPWQRTVDRRQALEVAIPAKLSTQLGSQPVQLPLKDRSLILFPSRYRWLGGDAAGNPQSAKEAAGREP
jgi:hypothetical protein